MVASVKQLRKIAVLRDRSSGDDGTMEQRLYVLQDPQGSVQALANTSGQVVERFAYDSLGNAQALDANGNACSATTNFTGTDNAGLIGQYFSGSVFGNGSGSPTANGSQYAWNILYQGDLFNAVAATNNTPNGALNPGQDSMLAPNPGMQMAGLSAYSQPTGFWGFYAQHEQGIQTGVAVTAGLAATVASFGILAPEAGAGIAAVIAAQAATGAAGGFTTGYLESGFNGGSFTQNLEAGTINGGIGAALGGGLSAAGIFAPYVGRALVSGFGSIYGGLTDAATLAGQYAGTFWEGFNAPIGLEFGMNSGLDPEVFIRFGNGLRALSSDPAVQEAIESGELNIQSLKQVTGVEEHHPIPIFMGGHEDQELYPVALWFHRMQVDSFHEMLAQNLEAAGFPPVGGPGGSEDDWADYFLRNSGSQDRSLGILLDTARRFDRVNSTDFLHYTWQNIIERSFSRY